ncbi:MAG TPA: general stress protein [Gemmataceae bacterium]|nr:general stress protein [Gemmataceae bacterium]
MTMDRHSTVVGVFEDRGAAQKAVAELRRVGFHEDQIGVLAREERGASARATGEPDTGDSKVAEGAATGVIAGAGVGALWALGIVTLGLPAVGPIIAGGIFASILASAAGTAVAGGILGALVGLGVPEEHAKYYESEFQTGRTLVTVKAGEKYREAENILHHLGAYNIHTAPAATANV